MTIHDRIVQQIYLCKTERGGNPTYLIIDYNSLSTLLKVAEEIHPFTPSTSDRYSRYLGLIITVPHGHCEDMLIDVK